MYSNTRSYLSRFSSTILFVVALLIVGILIILTINSADDSSETGAVESETATTSTSSTSTSSTSSLTYDQVEVTDSDTGATVAVESGTSSSSTSYSTSDPQTLAVTEVSLDSEDSVVIDTGAALSAGRVDAAGESITIAGVLPDTGTKEVITVAAALFNISLGLVYWTRSRQNLSQQLLIHNR